MGCFHHPRPKLVNPRSLALLTLARYTDLERGMGNNTGWVTVTGWDLVMDSERVMGISKVTVTG